MCFPAGLHYLLTFPTRMSKISQKSMCLYANFFEKGCFYIAIYANFSKRECRPAGKHISPRPSSATEIIGNCLHVSQTSHSSQNHLSKSNNLDMFALEANTLFLLFRSCSNRVKLRQCFVGTQKDRLNETLVFCVFRHNFFTCKNRTGCKIRGE